MSDYPANPEGPDPEAHSSEQVRVSHLSARVPERIGRGAFSTGAIVMTGANEFVIDFVQNVGGPPVVAARVVLAHNTMPQFVEALRTNLDLYTQRFGTPPQPPRNPNERQLTAQEIYDELRLPDELLSGSYATGVMIGHTASEFRIDFLTNLYPTAAVSARVFLSSPQIPRLLQSLAGTWQKFLDMRRRQQEGRDLPPGSEN
jgi:hypothetical protein